MAFSIVNLHLPDSDAVAGRDPQTHDLAIQIVADGYEPFSTASLGDGIVVSFRRFNQETPPTFDPAELPGQYL